MIQEFKIFTVLKFPYKGINLPKYFYLMYIETEAANGGVLHINCSAPASKLELDKLPGAK